MKQKQIKIETGQIYYDTVYKQTYIICNNVNGHTYEFTYISDNTSGELSIKEWEKWIKIGELIEIGNTRLGRLLYE